MEENWYNVVSQDTRTDNWVYWKKWQDFLWMEKLMTCDIITNPPFKYAQEFIEKALKISNWKVIMFLKLQFLESTWRYEFFKNTPLKKVLVHSKRPTLFPSDWPPPKNKWTIAYAWYLWEKWYKWEPIIDWII